MSDDEPSLNDDDEHIGGSVKLYIYDLSKGLAKLFSQILLGKHLNGIWHTAIVAYGREYFYGSGGIESVQPCGTVLGRPLEMLDLGPTQIPYSLFLGYLFGLGEGQFRPENYHLFGHNCNNFSQELATFLTGRSIPEYVLNLPKEVLDTPLGESLRGLLEPVNLRVDGGHGVRFGHQTLKDAENLPAEHFENRTTVRDELDLENDEDIKNIMASIQVSKKDGESKGKPENDKKTNGDEDDIADNEPSEWEQRLAAKRAQKNQEPPIVYKDVDAATVFNVLENELVSKLNEDDKQLLAELQEFVITDSGAWALGGQHLQFLTRILNDTSLPKTIRVSMLQFLQAASLKEDVILLLHMDRKEHLLMNYINDFETIPQDEQEEVAKLLCNMCLPYSSSDWLLYISEWQKGNQTCSNSRVTTRVAVNSLLSEKPSLQEKGLSLMYNLGLKEVFDDTATELASAILQYLHGSVPEDAAFKMLTALSRFMQISYKDVPQLVKMIGPDLGKFKGKSDRLDHLLEQINFKVNSACGAVEGDF